MGHRARWVLPLVIDPSDHYCVLVPVPKDIYHVAAFLGAMFELAKPYQWQNDPLHKAIPTGAVWLKIFNDLKLQNCDAFANCGTSIGATGDEFPMIRQSPTNPCSLETSIDGINWCQFADLSKCFNSLSSQPNGTQPQPKPGGCTVYNGKFNANEIFLVPTTVSTGDTVQLTTLQGAGSDSGIIWHCPDGGIFFAGSCGAGGALNGADPAPAINHMAVIVKIGAVYYNASSGVITVPGGIISQQVFIQVNDSTLTDDSGEYTIAVNVCNNQAAIWSHTINLTLGAGGFVADNVAPCGVNDVGVWTPGSGWHPTNCHNGQWFLGTRIKKMFALTHITSMNMFYDLTQGTNGGGAPMGNVTPYWYDNAMAIHAYGATCAQANGAGQSCGGSVVVDALGIGFFLSVDSENALPTNGDSRFYQLVVTGTGFDPF